MRALRDALRPSGVGSGFVADLTRSRDRLLLGERLVRAGVVVEAHVPGHEMPEVRFPDDQDMVEELPAEGSDEAFRERVHVGGADGRS
jgi:hypothetical protein